MESEICFEDRVRRVARDLALKGRLVLVVVSYVHKVMRYDLDHTTPEIESHTTNRPDLHNKTSRRRKEATQKNQRADSQNARYRNYVKRKEQYENLANL